MKAISCWKDGEKWYMIRDENGAFSHVVATRNDAVADGVAVFVELDEPRFLVRDESGRGYASELDYSDKETPGTKRDGQAGRWSASRSRSC